MKVPRFDPTVADAPQARAIRDGIEHVLQSGRFIGGPSLDHLEEELAAYLGVDHVVCVGSGTDALALGLMALHATHPSPSRTVVTSTLSFSATASAIYRAGLVPRFVDIDPDTMLIDWDQALAIEDARAVIPVHLYGRVSTPPDTCASAPIFEDACQAFTAAGAASIGTAAAFSFFPSKPLGSYGDGGAVATNDATFAHRVRLLARHGAATRYVSRMVGFNSRLDTLQAEILRVKLKAVDVQRNNRAMIAHAYTEHLGDLEWLRLPTITSGHAWHCYVARVEGRSRDGLVEHARTVGVDIAVQYPVPLHLQPAFRCASVPRLPHAERACSELVCLPIWSGMSDAQVETVIDVVRRY